MKAYAKYNAGNKITYETRKIKTDRGCFGGEVKDGIITEQFYTLDGFPCYWIKNESELILENQIIGLYKETKGPSLSDWARAFRASKVTK